MPALRTLLLAAILPLAAGCGTLCRNNVKEGGICLPQSSIYPACAFDGTLMANGGLYMILDLPFSLVTDTLLLPYDLGTRGTVKSTSSDDSRL
jgi:uncharacterized protein YceK